MSLLMRKKIEKILNFKYDEKKNFINIEAYIVCLQILPFDIYL